MSQLHRPRIDGPSPGKLASSVFAHLPSIRTAATRRISGFGDQRHLARCCPPTRRFALAQVANLAPASFRSLIGTRTAPTLAFPPSIGCVRAFLRAPLPSPTCSLLPRAMAGLSPASRLPCRSHNPWNARSSHPSGFPHYSTACPHCAGNVLVHWDSFSKTEFYYKTRRSASAALFW